MPLDEGQEYLTAEWISKIYSAFIMKPEKESVYEACFGIPSQYFDDAQDLWERLQNNRKEKPAEDGVVDFVPGEIEA